MRQGAAVTASDISAAMAGEASRRYQLALEASSAAPPATPPKFEALDLESASGRYNTVTCLDVMIHYPQVCPATPADPRKTGNYGIHFYCDLIVRNLSFTG